MLRSVPGSQQPLVLASVDAEGKLNLEERCGLYRLWPCNLDLYLFGDTGALFPASRQSGPKGCHTALPQINCKSVQPVPARVEEPVRPGRQSSSDVDMSNLPVSLVRQSSTGGDTRSCSSQYALSQHGKVRLKSRLDSRCVFRRMRR